MREKKEKAAERKRETERGKVGEKKKRKRARFGSTYTKIRTIQRRLAWPLRKDDTQIREAFHIFHFSV